ncbi:heat stress transcription factor A-5-like [Olea europaea var. sylvestris]|uniref:heat stress transcription factor A-5-like n=1 Tax=Olea europaea var. sylvestris TaxID=158386 RepID=UPI000C1D1281|nr:heat stress transcription factor A-5-like [Olea europaea var. sylvestris]
MDGGAPVTTTTGGGGGGSGGGPAPFLLKTYEMVDDTMTDDIVSWSGSMKSFVVWNPPEFARVLLPSYFKHNNFSSFIRQLNTYGFRKIDPEKWEFANEEFVKGKKHLLKNIHRRKPIHSHSQPQGSVDPERAAFEEEIEKLSLERTTLDGDILRFEQLQSAAKVQLESLKQRIGSMELRQEKLLTFLDKAVQNPEFVERFAQKLESMDFSSYNKKRRLPQFDDSPQTVQESIFVDNHSCSMPELGNIFHQDFCNKLRLELSPAVSDMNLLSQSTQSSNEDGGSPEGRMEGWSKDVHTRTGGVLCVPEELDLSDSSLSCKAGPESPKLHSLQQCLNAYDDGEGLISCQLNLTLASSSLEPDKSKNSGRMAPPGQEIGTEPPSSNNHPAIKTHSDNHPILSSPLEGNQEKQAPANDVFWEQFLTERPGCSDTEEASSKFRSNSFDDQEEKKSIQVISGKTQNVEHLSLG